MQTHDVETVSRAELRRRLNDPDLAIVDVRPLFAYNGWRADGEARGGHMPGAVAFPSAWLENLDDAELERLLQSKGIAPNRETVLYGNGSDDVLAARTRLTDLGRTRVRTYEHGWAEWAAGGFGNNALRTTAITKQGAMMTAVQHLYKGTYYPPEVACP